MNESYTSPDISTPDIFSDICKYVLRKEETQALKDIWNRLGPDNARRFIFLAERLEFIHKLDIVRKAIEKEHKNVVFDTPLKNSDISRTTIFKCTFLGEDFNGVHMDIESIQIYLSISCLDTLAGQPEYKSAFDWLKEKHSGMGAIKVEDLPRLGAEYDGDFGLRKLFLRQFLDGTSHEVQDKWLENFAPISIRDHNDRKDKGSLVDESLAAWNVKSREAKLRAIADKLYEIRSIFTHKSGRSFFCTVPVDNIKAGRKKALVRRGPMDLLEIILLTIADIANSNYVKLAPERE